MLYLMSIRVLVLLVLITQHSSLGFYIRNAVDPAADKDAATINSHNDEWGVLQNRLGLSHEKVEFLKSQKDQQGTKDLLKRYIIENPKYLRTSKTKKSKRSNNQFKRLFRALTNNMKGSTGTFKTSFNVQLTNGPLKPLKRARRKISVRMVSDMSSERVEHLLQMFYHKHNIEWSDFDNDRADEHNEDGEYNNSDISQRSETDGDSDYAYDNLYDDVGDVDLTAKSVQNSEYNSFQDLILQANRKQWDRESEETKLHSPSNDHFI